MRLLAMLSLPQVISRLLGQPLAGNSKTGQLQAMGQIRSNCRVTINHRGKLPPRVAQVLSQGSDGHVDGGQYVFAQSLAWVWWVMHSHDDLLQW
ncbi:hypothetical protein D3C80_1956020 [compost metagenome]